MDRKKYFTNWLEEKNQFLLEVGDWIDSGFLQDGIVLSLAKLMYPDSLIETYVNEYAGIATVAEYQ